MFRRYAADSNGNGKKPTINNSPLRGAFTFFAADAQGQEGAEVFLQARQIDGAGMIALRGSGSLRLWGEDVHLRDKPPLQMASRRSRQKVLAVVSPSPVGVAMEKEV